MKKGLVFGGSSFEHEISIVSAITLKGVLKQELDFIYCDGNRDFYLIEPKNMKAIYFSSGQYKKSKFLTLKKGGFYIEGIFNKKIDADIFINLIHGRDGEDGRIASLFEFFDIKFIGPRLEISALSYNKVLTKFLAQMAGVSTLKYQILTKKDREISINYPIILKPARLGSSIGIEVIKDKSELEYGLDSAFDYDDLILVEPFINGIKEYNLAGCKVNGEIKISFLEEPSKKEILDFDQKYLNFSGNSNIKKAEISNELELKFQNAFSKIYDCGFDGALIRCDFFEKDGEIYLNEINPNPGSLAYYLFDNFEEVLNLLAENLPTYSKIPIEYKYIKSISVNK
ncbi:MAG: D-alanine--D-alanine ligase [Campylobacter sp.]|nr:D-alanine--D-alanine ligase [Campylobacter sp.]